MFDNKNVIGFKHLKHMPQVTTGIPVLDHFPIGTNHVHVYHDSTPESFDGSRILNSFVHVFNNVAYWHSKGSDFSTIGLRSYIIGLLADGMIGRLMLEKGADHAVMVITGIGSKPNGNRSVSETLELLTTISNTRHEARNKGINLSFILTLHGSCHPSKSSLLFSDTIKSPMVDAFFSHNTQANPLLHDDHVRKYSFVMTCLKHPLHELVDTAIEVNHAYVYDGDHNRALWNSLVFNYIFKDRKAR